MKKKKESRRCDKVLMTREAEVLKYLRESRRLSMRKVGDLIGMSSSTINHAENGRMDLKPEFIFKLLSIYSYSYAQFFEMCKGNSTIPGNLRRECMEIMKRVDEGKLQTIKAILQSF